MILHQMLNSIKGWHSSRFVRDGKPARSQAERRQTRFTYVEGPMLFLGQQIVKRMQDIGWDAKIYTLYRSPEEQNEKYLQGFSKARAWSSAHQFSEAVDIAHKDLAWRAPEQFWSDLRSCAAIVEEQYGVELNCGYDWGRTPTKRGWDPAHIEIKDWRDFSDSLYLKGAFHAPSPDALAERFEKILPNVWRQYQKSAGFYK